jgi:MarR family transcriptional regulator for hemolysin
MKSKRSADKLTTYQQARLQVVGYRAIQAEINEILNRYDLNTSQWVILGWLHEHPAGQRITALADILGVETPLITALMQPMQQSDLVALKTDTSDRRAKLATLTAKGVGLVAKLEPALARQLAKFEKSLSSGELENYFHVLERFIYASKRQS